MDLLPVPVSASVSAVPPQASFIRPAGGGNDANNCRSVRARVAERPAIGPASWSQGHPGSSTPPTPPSCHPTPAKQHPPSTPKGISLGVSFVQPVIVLYSHESAHTVPNVPQRQWDSEERDGRGGGRVLLLVEVPEVVVVVEGVRERRFKHPNRLKLLFLQDIIWLGMFSRLLIAQGATIDTELVHNHPSCWKAFFLNQEALSGCN